MRQLAYPLPVENIESAQRHCIFRRCPVASGAFLIPSPREYTIALSVIVTLCQLIFQDSPDNLFCVLIFLLAIAWAAWLLRVFVTRGVDSVAA